MKKQSGFSLIELLVVVAIIGFLSAIGMAVYADVQAKGRDTKRKADIDSIAKVLEIHKTDAGGYSSPQDAWFGSSAGLPLTDPKGIWYCAKTGDADHLVTIDAPATSWSSSACPSGWLPVHTGTLFPATSVIVSWRVCSLLENDITKGDGTTTKVYCRYSVQ